MAKISKSGLHGELGDLLQDICDFLSNECFTHNVSVRTKTQATKLINRTQLQMQNLPKHPGTGEYHSYVDMQGNRASAHSDEDDDDDDDTYASLADCKEASQDDRYVVTVADLPTKNIPPHVKSGCLLWKTKTFFNFDRHKQVYAAVYESHFLVYSNEREAKPSDTFDLREWRSRPVEKLREGKSFILFLDHSKQFTFVAKNHDDMLQWMSAIEENSPDDVLINKPVRETISVPSLPPRPSPIFQINKKGRSTTNIENVGGMEYYTIQSSKNGSHHQPIYDAVQPSSGTGYENLDRLLNRDYEAVFDSAKKSYQRPNFLKIRAKKNGSKVRV